MKLEKKKQAIEAVQYTGGNEQEVLDFLVKHKSSIKKTDTNISIAVNFAIELENKDWVLHEPGKGLAVVLDSFVQEYYKEVE